MRWVARIIHKLSAAAPEPSVPTALRSLVLLDALHECDFVGLGSRALSNRRFRRFATTACELSGLALSLMLTAVPLCAQERARLEFDQEGGAILVEADRLSRESSELWSADGDVVISYGDTVLKAPRISYNLATGDAVAEGPVEIARGLEWLKGSRAELNLRTDTGTLHDAEGFTDQSLYVKAKRLIKTGPDEYTAQSGFLTACEEAVPKWSFTIGQARIRTGGTARLSHTIFKVKEIPVLYLPVLYFPATRKERSSGFLIPTTGNSNNKGRRISQSFYLVLGQSADLFLNEDYFSKRGFGHGVLFRARPNPVSFLELDWYFMDDRKDQGGTSFNGIGETRLPHGFRAVADFNLVSNLTFRQVFSDDFYNATLPTEESKVFLTNNFRSGSLNFLVSREENTLQGPKVVIRNTPTLQFKLAGQKLPGVPVYLDLDSAVEGRSRTGLSRPRAGTQQQDPLETPGITQRLDFFPQLYFSVPVIEGLRATPGFGFRETFYSDSLAPPEGGGESLPSGENISRRYFQLTLDLDGWGLSRVSRGASGGGWKHLVEPAVHYRYTTGIDRFHEILRFDEQDAVANTNELEYALYNRLFVKDSESGETREWFSLKLAQKYFFDPDFGGALEPSAVNQFFPLNTLSGFPYGTFPRRNSPVTTLARITPRPGYSFDVRGDYDLRFDQFRNLSVTGFLSRPGLYLGTTYFVTKELPDLREVLETAGLPTGVFQSHQVQAQITLGNLQRGLSLSTSLAYDLQIDRFLSHRSRLNYYWDCCGVSLEFQGFNVGIRQEQQFRFSFSLKGIGNFGTIRRPDEVF